MERVANSLAQQAIDAQDKGDANLYGRSAFNRYYYAVYLSVREMLQSGQPEYAGASHSDLPGLLEGAVLKRIKSEVQRQVKLQLLTHGEGEGMIHVATDALTSLADILRDGYRMRVIADYKPAVLAIVENKRVRLEDKNSDAARNWNKRARHAIGSIVSIWRKLGQI
ncbi:hypothetical protein [Burkholderia oklahomensis]|uniref:hypothetical protein n=1 Tax=Burkholderia oklahomensis TaxID=342113 RepID=UPI000F525FA1|nr:hypothetical protein [Burkholderia oklahomensis]MBI0360664.1 hypothetical protein [Burkholderia oklahomensis]